MARQYKRLDIREIRREQRRRGMIKSSLMSAGALGLAGSPLLAGVDPSLVFGLGAVPALAFSGLVGDVARDYWIERERKLESERRGGKKILGMPPDRTALSKVLEDTRRKGKGMIDKYLIGFSLETGEALWLDEEDLCSHACVFAKTGVGKTLWLESLIFQQMLRGRASGCTFIDAKRDSGTLAQIILMAVISGRIEDLVVVDPFDPVHSYNFTLTDQRADVKSRKVLRAGLPPTSDNSATKHYDRLAADSIARMVRAMESFGLAWSIHDIAVALSAFNLSYPHLRNMLQNIGARQAMVELGHMASSYRTAKGVLDAARLTDNLRGISSELHAISGSEMGSIFCTNYTDLTLSDAMLRGKIIYFMLPRLEEAEGAARMVKVFREDLEISIGEITSSRQHNLEDPHLVIVDEGSSTFGPTWANLFELARKGRFALLFGAQSTGGLCDNALGLSEAFYERVMANVNLKVMMRIGDNRTAQDMAEWFGKVATTRTSVGAGTSLSTSQSGGLDMSSRQSGGESQSISISEDEEYFVSPEELKHEMSAEKGLAWFDMGNGNVVKGRAFWFNSDLPDQWEGREYLVNFERFERDVIGLGDWVDEQILGVEKKESSMQNRPPKTSSSSTAQRAIAAQEKKQLPSPEDGPFKLDAASKFKPRGMVRTYAVPKEEPKVEKPEPKEQIEEKKEENGPFRLGAGNGRRPGNEKRLTVSLPAEVPESPAAEAALPAKKRRRRRKSSTMRFKTPDMEQNASSKKPD